MKLSGSTLLLNGHFQDPKLFILIHGTYNITAIHYDLDFMTTSQELSLIDRIFYSSNKSVNSTILHSFKYL